MRTERSCLASDQTPNCRTATGSWRHSSTPVSSSCQPTRPPQTPCDDFHRRFPEINGRDPDRWRRLAVKITLTVHRDGTSGCLSGRHRLSHQSARSPLSQARQFIRDERHRPARPRGHGIEPGRLNATDRGPSGENPEHDRRAQQQKASPHPASMHDKSPRDRRPPAKSRTRSRQNCQ